MSLSLQSNYSKFTEDSEPNADLSKGFPINKKMVAFSKPASLPFSCYEVGHTWTPYCSNAASDVALACFEEGLKIYSSVYILSSLLSGKVPNKDGLKRIILSIVRSAIFLACNGSGFISMFCLVGKLNGKYGLYSSAFIPSFIASFLAILIERPSRRPPLAIYVTNVASETIYNMLISRGIIKPIPYGQIMVFSLTLAALFRWYHTTKDTKKIFNLKFLGRLSVIRNSNQFQLINLLAVVFLTQNINYALTEKDV